MEIILPPPISLVDISEDETLLFNSLASGAIANYKLNYSNISSDRCKLIKYTATNIAFIADTVSGTLTSEPNSSNTEFIYNGSLNGTHTYEFEDLKITIKNDGPEYFGIVKMDGRQLTNDQIGGIVKSLYDFVLIDEIKKEEFVQGKANYSFDKKQESTIKIYNLEETCTFDGTINTIILSPQYNSNMMEISFKMNVTIKTSTGINYNIVVNYLGKKTDDNAISDFKIESISLNGKDFKPESIKESTKNVFTGIWIRQIF